MKITLFIVIFSLLLIPSVAGQTHNEIFYLNGSENLLLNNTLSHVKSDIIINENASLTIQNSHIILEHDEEFIFVIKDNSSLNIINSTIETTGPVSIRLMHNSKTNVTDSILGQNNQDESDTIGFGLSESAHLTIDSSSIGFIRLTHNSSSLISECIIGDLGTRSNGIVTDNMSEINRLTLFFTAGTVNITQTLHGTPLTLKEKDFIKDKSYNFNLNKTIIKNPPNVYLEQGFLTVNDTKLENIYIFGDSRLDIYNSEIKSINAGDYQTINIQNTTLGELICSNGDFDVKISESNLSALYTYLTTGLNLKIRDSIINLLQLMYAHTYAPQNIEFLKTEINNLYLKPGGPLVYQFSDSEIVNSIALELGSNDYPTPTFTGELKFNKNSTINFIPGEGTTSLFRVYKIIIKKNGSILSNVPIYIENNQTILYNGITNEDGEIILKIKFDKTLQLIENPMSGGPYLTNYNNFTIPMTIKINNEIYEFDFLSETPLIIEIDDIKDETSINNENQKINTIPFTLNIYGLVLTMIIIFFIMKTRKN